MNLDDKSPQMPVKTELASMDKGEAQKGPRSEEATPMIQEDERSGNRVTMEAVVQRDNFLEALKRVKRNKGSAGVDGMTVEQLADYLRHNGDRIREELLNDRYRPAPVRRAAIPKGDGKSGQLRELGIPSVLDRVIQQALLQVLQPVFDPTFSEHSYGFRPGRSAHHAVRAAQRFVQEGRRVVVDVDLEKFFDRVNHDILMGRLAKKIDDKRILRLIRRYLEAGVMVDGVVIERREGTPQGGPLSPFLSNFLLDEVDKELERRGHAFARYADDCNVYVHSIKAGERMMETLRRIYTSLHLRINEEKSAVDSVFTRKFLGYSMWVAKDGVIKLRVAKKAMTKMKDRVREMTRRNRGRSLKRVVGELRRYLLGWRAYFILTETPGVFRKLLGWIRRRLRALQLKQWKRGRTAYQRLAQKGAKRALAAHVARNLRRWWRNALRLAQLALPNRFFEELGLPTLLEMTSTGRTAGCGPARPVVWGAPG
jgi:RNA-directed DNA polymerase